MSVEMKMLQRIVSVVTMACLLAVIATPSVAATPADIVGTYTSRTIAQQGEHVTTIHILGVDADGTLKGGLLYKGPYGQASYPFSTTHKQATVKVQDGRLLVTLRRQGKRGMIEHDLILTADRNLVGRFKIIRARGPYEVHNYTLKGTENHLPAEMLAGAD